jgi:hypothetical protein
MKSLINGKMRIYFFLFSLFSSLTYSTSIFAQINNPLYFPGQYSWISNKQSFLLGLPDNGMMMLWNESETKYINSAKSYDGGLNWSFNQQVFWMSDRNSTDINGAALNSGRILLTFKNFAYYAMYSDDNGESWEDYYSLPTVSPLQRNRVGCTSLSKLFDNTVVFIFSYSTYPDTIPYKGIYTIRSSNGIDWSANQVIDSLGSNGNIVSAGANKDLLVYETNNGSNKNIAFRTSTDGGYSWSDQQILLSDAYNKFKPRIIKDNTDKLWLLYYRSDPTVFQGFSQSEIYFMTSSDQGLSWTVPEKFTNYAGYDELSSLSTWNGLPILSFGSTRYENFQDDFYQIYYGIPGESIDVSTPPFLYDFSIIPQYPEESEPITLRAFADDEIALSTVKVIINVSGNIDSLDLLDDGMHNDSLPGDNIYGVILENGFPNGTLLTYDFLLTDVNYNVVGFNGSYVTIPNFLYYNIYHFEANKLKLPLNNSGVLAAVQDSLSGLHFDESSVLFSGGFFLSGYHQNQMWTNAVASASLVEDYLPGPVGSDPNDFRNSLYAIKSTDPPFGQSWIGYQYAVGLGADFYDGDNDGIYNPIDLNGNNIWDSNEDRPDFLGDETVWCAYNDSRPANQRRFNQVNPMGIEIHQTLFAIGNQSNPIDNMIFIRYRIINKGTVASQFDSVFFGLWGDPDIGGHDGLTDDLTGCDTLINLGYSYNAGDDPSYGINPPAFGSLMLSGPVVYIPGETFIDVNGNGIYEEGIDTPIDTAVVNKGTFLGIEYYPGAKNLEATSFIHYINGDPTMNDPNNHIEARNYLLGRNRLGQFINPCNWQYGYVYGIPCNQVNPLFLYSGDPVSNYGWINTYFVDQRILTSTGPFTIKQNENVDIWTAYIVGRGSNALESVTKMKEYSLGAKSFYKSNFTELPSDVGEDKDINFPINYSLLQNYPNPFNPVTIIKYQLPEAGNVTLKVYDILGSEVATLVDDFQNGGRYQVNFDASSFASGVYIYRLNVNDPSTSSGQSYVSVRKMIVLK